MQTPEKTPSELLDEELVAYLDGQLDSEAARQVELRLANEEPVRRRLQELARSWDLLDQLPSAVAGDTFTRSTVEMVALAAEQELAEQQSAEPRQRRWRWLWGAAAAAVAGLAGFCIAANLWSDPNEKLLRDLPVIQNLEVFRQARDIDFLRKLSDEELFTDDAADSPGAKDEPRAAKEPAEAPAVPAVPDSLDERRELLDKMTPQEKDDLRAKFDKFEALPADEQDRLRHFYAQIDTDSQEGRLRRIMLRFHEWLKTLSPTERADLLGLDSTARIAPIKKLRHEQEAHVAAQAGGTKPSPDDMKALHHWMDEFVTSHQAEILKGAPAARQKEIAAMEPKRRNRTLTALAWPAGRFGAAPGKTIDISNDELEKLIAQLSPAANHALESQPSPQQRLQTVNGWIQAVRWSDRRGNERGPAISADDLNKFFESLPSAERDKLMSLPRDEMNQQLRRTYLQRKGGGRGNGPREGGGPRDSFGPRDRPRDEPKPEAPQGKPEPPPSKDDALPTKGDSH